MLGLSTMRKVMETASSQQRWVSMCLVVNMEMIEVQQQSWDWWKWRWQSVLEVIEIAASLSGDVRNFFYNCEFDAKITELVYLRSTLPSRLTLWESDTDHVEPLWSLLQSTQRLGHRRKRSRIKCCRGPLWCQRSSLVGLSSSSETRKHCHHRKGGTNKDNPLSNSLYAWYPGLSNFLVRNFTVRAVCTSQGLF